MCASYCWVVNPDNSITYPKKVYSGVTDANGLYSITVEVGDRQLDLEVTPQRFAYDVVQVIPAVPATARTFFSFDTEDILLYVK